MRRLPVAILVALLIGVAYPVVVLAADPVASSLTATTDEDTVVTIVLSASDDDPGDSPDSFAIEDAPDHGSLGSIAPSVCPVETPGVCTASVVYTPPANYNGPAVFTYSAASQDTVKSSPATVTITVTSVNDPVDARFDQVSLKATTTTTFNLFQANGGSADSAGPGEPISDVTITSVTKPAKGTATITGGGLTVTYDPSACATGSDTFDYTITDGEFTDTATVVVTIHRPGQGGISTLPITDAPAIGFITNSTMGTTVPMRLSWCGVTTSTTSVRSYRVYQSTDAGSTYPTKLFDATTAKSSTRNLSVNKDYRWKAKTTDTSGRAGNYRSSLVSRLTRHQDSSSRIAYTGAWSTSSISSASGGSERYTTETGAAATISVTNVRAFAIFGPRSSTRGSFQVFVDDVYVKTVSERATSLVYRKFLYARSLASGTGVSHTIRIESVGDGRIDVDAIVTVSAP